MHESFKDVLPPITDVQKRYLHLLETFTSYFESQQKEPRALVIEVIDDLLRILDQDSLLTISKQRETEVFQKDFRQYKNLLKLPVKSRNTDKFKPMRYH